MIIYVDADAIPRDALSIAKRVADEYDARLITVSSINHNITSAEHIQVDASPQATDMEIVRRICNDEPTLVITQDYGLAALVLARKASAISPSGRVYTEANIDQLLAERAVHAKFRRDKSVHMKGPKARTAADNQRFEQGLRNMLDQWRKADSER